jgi:CRISPR-associated exonuclease Cas4
MNTNITGVMVYYYQVCHRKLWYFAQHLDMESEYEAVKIGKAIDETSYQREDKHINIDGVINIDFIREKNLLHEVKKSRKIEEASIWQVKYYIYYLKKKGLQDIKGKIDYPLIRQSINVEFSTEDEFKLEKMLQDIEIIINLERAPKVNKMPICKKCAYYDLCWI